MAVRDDPTPDPGQLSGKALQRRRLTRRRFLVVGGVGVVGAAAGAAAALASKGDDDLIQVGGYRAAVRSGTSFFIGMMSSLRTRLFVS